MLEEDKKKQKPRLEDLNIKKKVNFYDKKVRTYLGKILAEILFACSFVGVIFLFQNIEKESQSQHNKEVKNIDINIARLQKDTRSIEGKVAEVKGYKERWDQSSLDLMGLKNIKLNYLKDKIKSISKKYKTHNLVTTESKKKKIEIRSLSLQKLYLDSADGNISFSVMTDIEGLDFIGDIINDLAGFFIISDMSITKKRDKYLYKEILKIKKKEYDQFIIDFNIDYTWYLIMRGNGI
jgi:hypothetical protein